jgi:hypothetical protein
MSQQEKRSKEFGEKREEAPSRVFATRGSFPGEINLQWDAVEGARRYVLQMSKIKDTKWIQVDIVTEPYYMFTGLDDKNEYKFRVAAVLKDGQGEWSEAISKQD